MKLTKTTVNRLPTPETGYAIHWDDTLPGFGVRMTANGIKAFILQRRIKGREKRITLGRYGALTVEQARKEATKLLGDIAKGQDPVADKARKRLEAMTLGEAFKAYLDTRDLKPRTVQDIGYAMQGFEDWKTKPLTIITRDMVGKRHRQLGEASPARANLAMHYLRAIFNFAMAHYTDAEGKPLLADNPVTRLSQTRAWFRVDRRQTVIKPRQLKPWMEAVLSLDNPLTRDYFLLVLLTGLRRQEALDLRWEHVDLTGRTLTVADTKNHQDHTLPLSDYLLEILTSLKVKAVGPYVFESTKGRLQNLRYAMEKVINHSGVEFTIHDLRRTFATVADSLDIPGYAVKALLNHKTGTDVTAGYVVINVERLRDPMQRITDYILKAGGLRAGADVVNLRKAVP